MRLLGRRNRGGHALLLVTVVVLILLGLAGAYLAIVSYQREATVRDSMAEAAFINAESGVVAALNELNSGIDYAGDGLGAVRDALGWGTYQVEIDPPYGGQKSYLLRAVGRCGGRARGLQVVVAPEPLAANRFASALFGDQGVLLQPNAFVDSFDSRQGAYADASQNRIQNRTYAGTKASVSSNGAVVVEPTAKIMGDVVVGPEASAATGARSYVDGEISQAALKTPVPPVEIPEIASQPGLLIDVQGAEFISAGEHHYERVAIAPNGTLTIRGPATLVVDAWLVGAGASVVIDGSAGPVTIIGTGAFEMHPSAQWVSTLRQTSELSVQLAASDVPAQVFGRGRFYGTVYAPGIDLTLDRQTEMFGAVAARRVELTSSFQLHYDEVLLPATTAPQFRVQSWEEMPAGPESVAAAPSGEAPAESAPPAAPTTPKPEPPSSGSPSPPSRGEGPWWWRLLRAMLGRD